MAKKTTVILGCIRQSAAPFHLDMRKSSTVRVTELWNKLPRVIVESPSPQICKTCLDTILGNLLERHCLSMEVGPGDLQRSLPTQVILFQKPTFSLGGGHFSSPINVSQQWAPVLPFSVHSPVLARGLLYV